VPTSIPSKFPTNVPSLQPSISGQPSLSPSKTYEGFVEMISLETSKDSSKFLNVNSPQSLARRWMLENNTRIERDEISIKQAYILAVFYYTLNGPNWNVNDNFLLSDVSECHWEGVRCNLKDHLVVIFFGKFPERGFSWNNY